MHHMAFSLDFSINGIRKKPFRLGAEESMSESMPGNFEKVSRLT